MMSRITPRRARFLAALAVVSALLSSTSAEAAFRAHARDLCVGSGSGCYPTVQAAVDAARDGDTIRVPRGTFAGGVRIDVSIHLVGAGARSTTIRGGGPVLTIGAFNATTEPTVSISGITVRGGLTHSSAQSRALIGKPGVLALGGGIEVPPGANFSNGAKVTIEDSIITRNRVAPSATIASGLGCGNACPFALAGGGGIDNWGRMTLDHVTVSHNEAGGHLTSDANAAGIYTEQGSLTLHHSVVTRNRTVASHPNGRFAEGGGISVLSTAWFMKPRLTTGTLTIENSRVTNNTAKLSAGFGSNVEAHANAGGIVIGGDDDCTRPSSGCVKATIRDSAVSGNTVTVRNTAGDAFGFSGGINDDGSLVLRNSTIGDNAVQAAVPLGSTSGASADSGGIGMGGYASITNTHLSGNIVNATAPGGTASAAFGGLSAGNPGLATTIRHSTIAGNALHASTRTGSFVIVGAGIGHLGGGPLVVRDTAITRNVAAGKGPTGVAHGGGIWNASPDGSSPLGALRIFESTITLNVLDAASSIRAQGGGIFTTARPTIEHSTIAQNRPDQCRGC
jgi:hypothetical protein